ncbi:MAG: hypothetical protein QM784_36330 [Polyangiaceae bacterium]
MPTARLPTYLVSLQKKRFCRSRRPSRLLRKRVDCSNPPSAIAIHRRESATRIDLAPRRVERQQVRERLEYRDGHVVDCTADTTRSLEVRYQFENGQPMALVRAPEVSLSLTCNGPVPVELPTRLPALNLVLVLRDEILVVVAPAADRRQFLPAD